MGKTLHLLRYFLLNIRFGHRYLVNLGLSDSVPSHLGYLGILLQLCRGKFISEFPELGEVPDACFALGFCDKGLLIQRAQGSGSEAFPGRSRHWTSRGKFSLSSQMLLLRQRQNNVLLCFPEPQGFAPESYPFEGWELALTSVGLRRHPMRPHSCRC